MNSRGNRKAVIAVITAASVLVVAVIVTAVFFTVRSQHRQDDVDEASRVATKFNKDASAYRAGVSKALSDASPTDAKAMGVALDEAVAKAPELGGAPTWGKTHSTTYLKAVKAEKSLKDPYEETANVLDEAVVGQAFVKAAREALKVRSNDFVKNGILPNGGPIRDKLIPGFKKTLATFTAVEVPKGQDTLAKDIRTALQTIIDSAEKVADNLDSGRGGSIDGQKEYSVANLALFSYETSLRAQITEAVADAAGTVSGQQDET